VDFFSKEQLVDTVTQVLSDPKGQQAVRDLARKTVLDAFVVGVTLNRYLELTGCGGSAAGR
jgi:hypothetical protein